MRALASLIVSVLGMTSAACSQSYAQDAAHTEVSQVKVVVGSDVAERLAVQKQVKAAIDSSDFAKLNALEARFVRDRTRFASGGWALSEYYKSLASSLYRVNSEDGCQARSDAFITAWRRFDPKAPAPIIASAGLLLSQAWCVRGNGWASQVSPEAMALFRKQTGQAYQMLTAHPSAAVDPHYYAVLTDSYIDIGKDVADMEELLDRAIAVEPSYYETYYRASRYYKTRWYGAPGDLDRFARMIMNRTRKADGRGVYARIYLYIADCHCRDTVPTPDRELMREALRDIIVSQPVSRNVNRAIREACLVGDYAESAELFRLLGPGDEAMGWESPADQARCREQTRQGQAL